MIICCGEALIDMLPRKLESGEDVFLPVPGEAVFNTAVALGRLGLETGFVSGVSTDMFGDQLMAALEVASVKTHLCVRADRPSTLAFVKLTDGHAEYVFMDENSAGRMLSAEKLPPLPEATTALHFGAISLIPEPCGTAYETLMSRHASAALISLDPNIRPGFIKDEPGHRARIERMIAMADIVKVSDEDLAWIAPDTPFESAIDAMVKKAGVSVVVLTKGAAGVTVHTGSGHIDVPAEKTNVVDTIGAGDSFNGGFLAGLAENHLLSKQALREASAEDLRPAAMKASRVAAITVSRAGANPPFAVEL